MSIEVMRQALEALEQIKCFMFHPAKVFTWEPSIIALRTAIEQAEKRQWIGLTDEEIVELIKPAMRYYGYNPNHAVLTSGAGFVELADAIEAKLKEKNAA